MNLLKSFQDGQIAFRSRYINKPAKAYISESNFRQLFSLSKYEHLDLLHGKINDIDIYASSLIGPNIIEFIDYGGNHMNYKIRCL